MSPLNNCKSPWDKCRTIFTTPSLVLEFQTCTLKLLAYNYVIILLIANQDVGWNYQFRDSELSNRLGHELIEPKILSKFGCCFCLLTLILNTLAIQTLLDPSLQKRKYVLLCILWNLYTISAIAENLCEIVWTMLQLEVQFRTFGTIFIVGIFMITFQSKLTLQVSRFYEYLNYMHTIIERSEY